MIYTRPTSRVYPLNLRERIASSGHPIPPVDQAADEPRQLQLGSDPADNTRLITEALAAGDVILAPGEYTFTPGIEISGRTLDLGGAHLTSAVRIYNGGFFTLTGERPCIRNGRISGRYDAAPGEDGYIRLEDPATGSLLESAVKLPIGGFSDTLIVNVTFDHVSGYVICPSTAACAVRHFSPADAPADGWCRFDLTPGYPYVTARHAVGYNYEISTDRVRYRFTAADGSIVSETSGIPGDAIRVPEGAVSVAVQTVGDYVPYGLFEYLYDNSLAIRGCEFRCNQRLAICNLPGVSIVEDCVSVSNGYPRVDHKGVSWDSSTSGFIDVEDVQTPVLAVRRCSSDAENLGIASRAYELRVEDSPRLATRLYGGWKAFLRSSGRLTFNSLPAALHATTDTDGEIDDTFILHAGEIADEEIRLHACPTDLGRFLRCKIAPAGTGHLWYGASPVGIFDGCEIDLTDDWMLSHGKPILKFYNCRIRLNGHHLINQQTFSGGSLYFRGCEIDHQDDLVTGLEGIGVTIE